MHMQCQIEGQKGIGSVIWGYREVKGQIMVRDRGQMGQTESQTEYGVDRCSNSIHGQIDHQTDG